ncbi:MAG: dTMP kinase [Synergistaceae bacterium]|nr:dTMP kinase [Synergistaceae bacterium]
MRISNRFITIEGIDGCGKSTQAEMLSDWLSLRFGKNKVVKTYEPGGSGNEIRNILLNSSMSERSELLLFLADRMEHVQNIILPALCENKWVICERYIDSTIVYQSFGRGIPACEIERLFAWCEFPVPQLTIYLDVPVDVAVSRVDSRGNKDRIESVGIEFIRKIYSAYKQLSIDRKRIVRVDASLDIHKVADSVRNVLEERFELKS